MVFRVFALESGFRKVGTDISYPPPLIAVTSAQYSSGPNPAKIW